MSNALRITEVDENGHLSGRSFELCDVEFAPLGYSELKDAKLAQPITIPLEGSGTMNVVQGIEGAFAAQRGRFRTSLESHFTSRAIGLVRDGWLPSALAVANDTIVLPDRCVVAQFNARLLNGVPQADADKDFIDLFADTAVRINPLLFVLEGDARRNPTAQELRTHLSEAARKIRSALPKSILVAADDAGLKGALGLIEDEASSMVRKEDFLLRISSSLVSPVAKRSIPARWDEVMAAAKDCNLPPLSLVVLAALSTIMTPNGKSPARRLLKFDRSYTRKDAYNALADLRSLQILMYVFALFPNQRVMLCTADRDLALFWVGLHASNFSFSDGRLSVDFKPDELLPNMTDELWQSLVDR